MRLFPIRTAAGVTFGELPSESLADLEDELSLRRPEIFWSQVKEALVRIELACRVVTR